MGWSVMRTVLMDEGRDVRSLMVLLLVGFGDEVIPHAATTSNITGCRTLAASLKHVSRHRRSAADGARREVMLARADDLGVQVHEVDRWREPELGSQCGASGVERRGCCRRIPAIAQQAHQARTRSGIGRVGRDGIANGIDEFVGGRVPGPRGGEVDDEFGHLQLQLASDSRSGAVVSTEHITRLRSRERLIAAEIARDAVPL